MRRMRKPAILILAILLAAAFSCRMVKNRSVGYRKARRVDLVVKTMPDAALIASPSAKDATFYHKHLVRPGLSTSYLVRLHNAESQTETINLSLSNIPDMWSAALEKTSVSLEPGKSEYVRLLLSPSDRVGIGASASVAVNARSASGKTGQVSLEAETTNKHKIYFISIDSLNPEYLELNAKGNGPGKDGDWLMPVLHGLVGESLFYQNHKDHLIAATDMNHGSYLSGALPGELGLYMVNLFIFGFDDDGHPIIKTTPQDLMYYGEDRKPVTTIFNVVKDPAFGGSQNAFTAYVSGKAWVPEHYRNPVFGLDRIATVNDYPDYVTPTTHKPVRFEAIKQSVALQFAKMKDPDRFLWEDKYTADQVMEVIDAEDPDVCYILLGGIDAAGHMFGAANDLGEWKNQSDTEDLSKSVSKVNWRANRLGMIKTVKAADEQLGRLIAYLKDRGVYEQSYVITESDHNMESNFFKAPKIQDILAGTGYSPKSDYYAFTASQIAGVFLRPGHRDSDAQINSGLEKALEEFRMKNPLTGQEESPMVVLDREEMRTGIDKATGEKVTEPMELYSEYYIEHRKPGELMWPDLIFLARKYYQFPLLGLGLANVGGGKLGLPLPPISVYVGGHGGPSTQSSLLLLHGPGIAKAAVSLEQTRPSDVAPSLYFLEGYQIPASVQGKRLPGLGAK